MDIDPAQATLTTCISAIAEGANAEGARAVKVVTGRVTPRRGGVRKTTLGVTITYPSEIRQAIVVCSVDRDGNVTIETTQEAGP